VVNRANTLCFVSYIWQAGAVTLGEHHYIAVPFYADLHYANLNVNEFVTLYAKFEIIQIQKIEIGGAEDGRIRASMA
jgi:hypothetical protein